MCAEPFSEEKQKLRDVEAKLLTKRAELSKFETEYREVVRLAGLVTRILFPVMYSIPIVSCVVPHSKLDRSWHNSQR